MSAFENTNIEKAELALIPIFGLATLYLNQLLPSLVGFGKLIIWLSGLLLFQSLVRDLAILATQRNTQVEGATRTEQLMCLESTVGILGLFAGSCLLFSGLNREVSLSGWVWSLMVTLVLIFGFWLKDYVFSWNPWRIKKEKDHLNILVTWKR